MRQFLLWIAVFFAGFGWSLAGVLAVSAQVVPGVDLAASIERQDGALGTAKGVITLDRAGMIGRDVTLGAGHDLQLGATVQWNATVRLMGGNHVRCGAGARIEAGTPAFAYDKDAGALLVAKGVRDVSVEGCRVHAAAASVLLAGYPVSGLAMVGNVLDGLTLVATGHGASDGLRLERNSVTMSGPGARANAALLLFYASDVEATGNSFAGALHGAQWWGGDSGAAGMGVAQVVQAGRMHFVGNTCRAVLGSCVWGSMGSDVEIRGNTADGCGDVCFDTEGGLRTAIDGNTATGCANGCAAVFFFSDETEIAGNHFSGEAPGGGLILIKNASGDPSRHARLMIRGNELRCEPKVCRAVYQEAAGVEFVANTVTDGVWLPVGYGHGVRIDRNVVTMTQAIEAGGAVLAAPDVIGNTVLEVTNNVVRSRVAQPAGSACVQARWTDFNAADRHVIAGNVCEGAGGGAAFPVGLRVGSSGGNAGLSGLWIVGWNNFGGGAVEHTVGAGSHETWIDATTEAGARAAAALPGCATTGRPARLQRNAVPVCLGPAGFGMVQTAPQ